MEAYTDFASVYDTFMDETPYEEWAEFLHNLIKEYGISEPVRSGKTEATVEANDASTASDKEEILDSEKNLVLDLGCGTGTLTELLYRKGYDMIGVDFSQEMLNIAMIKYSQNSGVTSCRPSLNVPSLFSVGVSANTQNKAVITATRLSPKFIIFLHRAKLCIFIAARISIGI